MDRGNTAPSKLQSEIEKTRLSPAESACLKDESALLVTSLPSNGNRLITCSKPSPGHVYPRHPAAEDGVLGSHSVLSYACEHLDCHLKLTGRSYVPQTMQLEIGYDTMYYFCYCNHQTGSVELTINRRAVELCMHMERLSRLNDSCDSEPRDLKAKATARHGAPKRCSLLPVGRLRRPKRLLRQTSEQESKQTETLPCSSLQG